MARKTTGSSSPRTKKTSASVLPVPAQGGAEMADMVPSTLEISREVAPESRTAKSTTPVAINEHSTNHSSATQPSSSSNSSTQASSNQQHDHSNVEEQVRQRAYELYLERRANGNGRSGDPHQDWVDAEREVRSRSSSRERKSA